MYCAVLWRTACAPYIGVKGVRNDDTRQQNTHDFLTSYTSRFFPTITHSLCAIYRCVGCQNIHTKVRRTIYRCVGCENNDIQTVTHSLCVIYRCVGCEKIQKTTRNVKYIRISDILYIALLPDYHVQPARDIQMCRVPEYIENTM